MTECTGIRLRRTNEADLDFVLSAEQNTEGVLRECIKTGDTFESPVLMSMLRDEYYTQRFKDR